MLLKFQLNRSIFMFSSLKSVIVNFGFLNLFLDIWIRIPEYGSGSRIQAQIECGSNRIRIRNTVFHHLQIFKHVSHVISFSRFLSHFPRSTVTLPLSVVNLPYGGGRRGMICFCAQLCVPDH
jgi:hypothetical protein